MSVNLWAYEPEKCDGDYCYGDCDNCAKQLRHSLYWAILMTNRAVRTTVDKLNELQEQRAIKKERSMFE